MTDTDIDISTLDNAVLKALYTQISVNPEGVQASIISAAINYLKQSKEPADKSKDTSVSIMRDTLERYTNVMDFPNATPTKGKR